MQEGWLSAHFRWVLRLTEVPSFDVNLNLVIKGIMCVVLAFQVIENPISLYHCFSTKQASRCSHSNTLI